MKYNISDNKKTLLKVYDIDSDIFIVPDTVEIISDYAFLNINIKKLIAPNVKVINYSAFDSGDIEQIEAPKLIRIDEWAFQNCINLKNINLPKLEIIGYGAFVQCTNLQILNIPNCSYISEAALKFCDNLSSINSKLSKEQLIMAFDDINQYNNYIQRNRDYKLKQLIHEL